MEDEIFVFTFILTVSVISHKTFGTNVSGPVADAQVELIRHDVYHRHFMLISDKHELEASNTSIELMHQYTSVVQTLPLASRR